ncbi:uncharacterized protein LOC112565187 [Pomacea canaliculata]|uniref:uncharacterized protein LOC112565187 n=1 Tax=Pomacea canaliculata TaxID=400727 RepID=UPI000D7299AA|nr:uncharacterized protein LOC112565187 [Pomacea canaliculata]
MLQRTTVSPKMASQLTSPPSRQRNRLIPLLHHRQEKHLLLLFHHRQDKHLLLLFHHKQDKHLILLLQRRQDKHLNLRRPHAVIASHRERPPVLHHQLEMQPPHPPANAISHNSSLFKQTECFSHHCPGLSPGVSGVDNTEPSLASRQLFGHQ